MGCNKPIGIFDSGLGGLSVYKELKRILPNERFIYFGDTARVPYGNKSPEVIRRYAFEITYFLAQKGIKMLIVACNTASSIAVEELSNAFKFPVIGVVQSVINLANSYLSESKRIGVIGTKQTIKSQTYQNLIKKIFSDVKIYAKACPLFVPIIEEGLFNSKILKNTIEFYLLELKKIKIDTLILGCTHYPLISEEIVTFFNNKVKLINPGYTSALYAKHILENEELLNDLSSQDEFYLSDKQENFEYIAKNFLGFNILNVNILKGPLI